MSDGKGKDSVVNEEVDSDWLRAAYHEAEADLRWAKERGTNVTYWSVILFAGVAAAARVSAMSEVVWVIALVFLAGTACYWLVDLNKFAASERERAHEVLKDYPRGWGYDPSSESESGRKHCLQLVAQITIVLGAVIVAAYDIVANGG